MAQGDGDRLTIESGKEPLGRGPTRRLPPAQSQRRQHHVALARSPFGDGQRRAPIGQQCRDCQGQEPSEGIDDAGGATGIGNIGEGLQQTAGDHGRRLISASCGSRRHDRTLYGNSHSVVVA